MTEKDFEDGAKFKLLKEGLENLWGIEIRNFREEICNTNWKISKDNGWVYCYKSKDDPLSEVLTNTPNFTVDLEIRIECYCKTEIIWNHLIKHKETGKLAFIGSHCAKRCKIAMVKTCIDCDIRHSKRTLRCEKCRIKCNPCSKVYKKNIYHDDNLTCEKCSDCDNPHRMKTIICDNCVKIRLDSRLSFNSSKYKLVKEAFNDDSYMTFLMSKDWFKNRVEYELYLSYENN